MGLRHWPFVAVIAIAIVLLGSCVLIFNLPRTETFSGAGGTISSGTTTEFPLTVDVAGEIREIESVSLTGLSHPDSQALNIQLQAPGLFDTALSQYRGNGSQSFDGDYVFVDLGSDSGADTYLPESGDIYETTYESSTDLDEFDGKDTHGVWKLVFFNTGATGSLDGWSLELTYKEY